jgi:hypothetical protein
MRPAGYLAEGRGDAVAQQECGHRLAEPADDRVVLGNDHQPPGF